MNLLTGTLNEETTATLQVITTITHKSFNYSSTQSDMLYFEFFIGTTNEI